jgi:hypothetical protein
VESAGCWLAAPDPTPARLLGALGGAGRQQHEQHPKPCGDALCVQKRSHRSTLHELSGFLTYLEEALEQPVEATVMDVAVPLGTEVARLLAAYRHWAGQDPRPKATP